MRTTESAYINQSLIEATYLYCYKRLQNAHDSEELTQEILFEAVKALHGGKSIERFYPWYWAMAKNRFNLFLRMKQYGAVQLEEVCSTLRSDQDLEEALLKSEAVSELNYAISRLSQLHREVIILYYLKEMNIPQIAEALSVPKGTVKRRLFDAKINIRKGMNAMTNCGKASYAPAELFLWGGYGIPDYWDHISDIMTKQIFVVCSEKSKTIREIADEIGVAPVYFEEKLKYLVEKKFIKEISCGNYITDFCIYPRETWEDFQRALGEVYGSVGGKVTDAILSCESKIRALDFYGNDFPMRRLLWILYCVAANMLSCSMLEIYNGKWRGKIPGQNGKDYRIAGTVQYPDETFTDPGQQKNWLLWSNLHKRFRTSGYAQIEHANLFQAWPFSDRDHIINESNADLFMRIYDCPELALTPNEEEMAANLIRLDYLHKKDGKLYPSVPIMTYECQSKIRQLLREATSEIAFKYVEAAAEVGERILLPATRKDLIEEYAHFVMGVNAFFPIGFLYYYGMNGAEPALDIPKDYSLSSNAICIYYRK